MRAEFNPGLEKSTINLYDSIVYSHVKDLSGNPMNLELSVMASDGNVEMRLAAGKDDSDMKVAPRPCLFFIPGGGWRGADKNLMLGEMTEFVRAGYVVVSPYYRNSAEGKWPAQIQDVKTAIRFMRANAEKYNIDPDNFGIFGRSAGGQLSAFAAQNLPGYDTEEWSEYSSEVQACIDMFGPVDLGANMDMEMKKFSDPNFRWHKLEDTHGGAVIGGDPATIRERADQASVTTHVNDKMAPIMMLHGTADPIVPPAVSSEILYKKIVEAGLEDRCEYYLIPGARHGSPEFFQDKTKELMIGFFDKHLRG